MLDLGVDTSSVTGEAMAGVVSMFAQMERRRIGERTNAEYANAFLDNITFLPDGSFWAVSSAGGSRVLRYAERGWSRSSFTGPHDALYAIAARSSKDVWAVGKWIAHWDGAGWRVDLKLGDDDSLFGVDAVSASDVWAVGTAGLDRDALVEHYRCG